MPSVRDPELDTTEDCVIPELCEPERIMDKLRHPGTPEGDDLVVLTGTEAVVLLNEIERLQAAELELEGQAGPVVRCDYCDEVAAGLGVDKDKQLVPVCHGHRGTAERLFPIPPKWERRSA